MVRSMRLFLLTFAILLNVRISGQELLVKSMKAAPIDLSASTYERKDLTGEACGLVKVQLAATGAQFEGNVIGQVEYNLHWTTDSSSWFAYPTGRGTTSANK